MTEITSEGTIISGKELFSCGIGHLHISWSMIDLDGLAG